MEKKIITSDTLKAIGPYSLAVEAGGFIFISGQIPLNPATGEIISDITTATRQVITNLEKILAGCGLALDSVIKTTIFLKNMGDFAAFNEVYAGFFPDNPPARSTIEAGNLFKGVPLEIEAIAVR